MGKNMRIVAVVTGQVKLVHASAQWCTRAAPALDGLRYLPGRFLTYSRHTEVLTTGPGRTPYEEKAAGPGWLNCGNITA
jgi:hypothetical protein